MLALIALLLGQCALAAHETDQHQHVPGSHCEWCIAAAPLHAALGADALALPSVSGTRHAHVAHTPCTVRSFHTSVYFGRAPPLFSC